MNVLTLAQLQNLKLRTVDKHLTLTDTVQALQHPGPSILRTVKHFALRNVQTLKLSNFADMRFPSYPNAFEQWWSLCPTGRAFRAT